MGTLYFQASQSPDNGVTWSTPSWESSLSGVTAWPAAIALMEAESAASPGLLLRLAGSTSSTFQTGVTASQAMVTENPFFYYPPSPSTGNPYFDYTAGNWSAMAQQVGVVWYYYFSGGALTPISSFMIAQYGTPDWGVH